MNTKQVRQLLRKSFLDTAGIFSAPAKGIHILNGHRISLQNPKTETFEDLLNKLSKTVTFIRIEDAVEMISNKVVADYPLVAFTFDDGFEEQYSLIAPVLEEFGVNAAFFINPNFAGGSSDYIKHFTEEVVMTPDKLPMTWEQIIDLDRRGHIIGAHTLDHYMINDDNTEELKHQICNCKLIIEDKLNKPCDYFAFPYGRLEHANTKSIEIAANSYKYVFSQSDYKNYFSFDGRVINRRHFEPDWDIRHVRYFLSCNKKY